jgi:hypothetical protein
MMFLCTYVLYPELVHLLRCSPFYLSLLLMMSSTDLKILYLFLYRKYVNHIHLLNFLFVGVLSYVRWNTIPGSSSSCL